MTPTAAAQAAVRELRLAVEWLAASLLPGTGKPYRAPTMTAAARAERDLAARLERLERVGIAPGEGTVPLDLDVADLLSEILATADELADLVCAALSPVLMARPASSAFADPGPYLDLLDRWLPLAAETRPSLARLVEGRCDGLTERTHHTLGLLGDGQTLDAICPWCQGRASDAPVGGAKTMRVRAQLPAGKVSVASVDPAEVRWFVVCEGVNCEPGTADCGHEVRGRPAWDLSVEAEWLADRLTRAAS